MDASSRPQELFPDSNNIQITGSRNLSQHEDSGSDLQEDDAATTTDTMADDVLKSLIHEQHWHDLEEYQMATLSNRFYVSDLYARRRSSMLSKMTEDEIMGGTYTNSHTDFEKYNKKVRQEYQLREKLEGLLRQQRHGDVKILTDESVCDHFLAGKEFKTPKAQKYGRLNSMIPSVIKKIYPKKRIDTNHPSRAVSPLLRSSTDTFVIDHASYGPMAIDEGSIRLTKWDTVDSSSPIDQNVRVQSQRETASIIKQIENIFNDPKYGEFHVQRKLRVRHIQMISVGACLSVGIFLTSGKAFSIAGPLGTLLGFALTGSIVLATLLSFTELSTLIPVSSGFSGLASRFVEDAFGFALGWTYWFSCMIALPAQVLASTFYLTYYPELNLTRGHIAGFVTLFLAFNISINLMDVRFLGEVVYIIGLLKILITIAMIIAMVILNSGHGGISHRQVGFRYWDSSKSLENITYGLFRPTFDLSDAGGGSRQGTSGSSGRFLGVVSVMLISTFAYSGVEMTFLASGEAINPRKTIPSAIKRTFCIVLVLYMLIILTVGINFYCGDPRLSSYYNGSSEQRFASIVQGMGMGWQISDRCQTGLYSNTNNNTHGYSSPWVLALQNFGLCTFAEFFNAILIFFTTAAGVSSLFSSSRTLYSMAVQRKAPSIFQKCSKSGIPYVSVLFSGAFGVVAYLAVDKTAMENFDVLSNIASASTSIIWMGLNLSFLRFFYALKRRQDIISRNDQSYPYRSPFQPFLAIYGLMGCTLFIIFMGYTNFLHKYWNTKSFFSAYGGLILFTICYIGYKIMGTSKIQRLDQLDMDSGRREMDRSIWDEHQQYSGPYRERLKRLVNWLY